MAPVTSLCLCQLLCALPTHAASVVRCSIELTISYVYLALHSYADRDNVGLPGFAAWFKDESDGERDHAQLLLNFQVRCPMMGCQSVCLCGHGEGAIRAILLCWVHHNSMRAQASVNKERAFVGCVAFGVLEGL